MISGCSPLHTSEFTRHWYLLIPARVLVVMPQHACTCVTVTACFVLKYLLVECCLSGPINSWDRMPFLTDLQPGGTPHSYRCPHTRRGTSSLQITVVLRPSTMMVQTDSKSYSTDSKSYSSGSASDLHLAVFPCRNSNPSCSFSPRNMVVESARPERYSLEQQSNSQKC